MPMLLADENFSFPAVVVLRQLGDDVLTIAELGKAGQKFPDEDVFARAVELRRVILTFNRKHFYKLHRMNTNHAGIFMYREDKNAEALAHRIHEKLASQPDFSGQLVRINRPNPEPS
jgi:hypothetical protein